jgi:hypothetical protein
LWTSAVDEVAGVDPIYMTVPDKQATLTGVARARARLEAVELKVLAASDDIAEATGDRSTATWLANTTRDAHGSVRRKAALASALDQRWTQTAEAFAAGELNLAQARVIAEALQALPADLGGDLLAKAEALLVTEAATLGPRELKVFGSRVLEYLAPDIAEEAEYQRLLAASAGLVPPPVCTCGPEATGPPTSTPGSPTTPPAGSGPTSTPSPHPAAATSATRSRSRSGP